MKAPRALVILLLLCTLLGLPGSALAGTQSDVTHADSPAASLSEYAAGNTAGLLIPDPAGGTRYTVKRGDTLGSIAARFGVSAAAIARANGITNPNKIRIGQTLTIPAGGTSPKQGGSAVPSGSGLRFVASISQQRCWLYRGNAVQAAWRCSTGRRGSPTVPGTYAVRSKIARAWGGTWNFWMPYWLGIYMAGSMENGIHGLPYSPSTGARYWGNAIGSPISYGCVVLDDASARTLFNVAYIGMPVIILR